MSDRDITKPLVTTSSGSSIPAGPSISPVARDIYGNVGIIDSANGQVIVSAAALLASEAAATRVRTGKTADAQQTTVAGENALIPLLFGTQRVGAKIAGAVTAAGGYLVLLCAWCQGEVDSVVAVDISDLPLPPGVTVTSYVGAPAPIVDNTLLLAYALYGIAYADTMPGTCYSVVLIDPNAKLQGFPLPTATVRGLKVSDLGQAYVRLDAGQYARTPDAAGNDLNENIAIEACLTLDSWASGATQFIAGKWGPGTANHAYAAYLSSTGHLVFGVNKSGTGVVTFTSSAAVGFAAGDLGWLRAVFRKDNGASASDCTFYTSPDGIEWTQLGTVQTAATIATLASAAQPVQIGRDNDSASQLVGKVWSVRCWTPSHLVFEFLPWNQSAAISTWVGPSGETWSLQGGAAIPPTFFRYSETPLNILAEYIRNKTWGMAKAVDFRYAMQVYLLNTEQIGSPPEDRHRLSLLMDVQQDNQTNINVLRDYAHCTATDEGGVYYLVADTVSAITSPPEPPPVVFSGWIFDTQRIGFDEVFEVQRR